MKLRLARRVMQTNVTIPTVLDKETLVTFKLEDVPGENTTNPLTPTIFTEINASPTIFSGSIQDLNSGRIPEGQDRETAIILWNRN
jgi:hypothetical protein